MTEDGAATRGVPRTGSPPVEEYEPDTFPASGRDI